MSKRSFLILFLASCFLGLPRLARADVLKKPPEVPTQLRFIRSLDLEGFVQEADQNKTGVQTFRIRTRYMDPDVNAFVGLMLGMTHFNNEVLFDPDIPQSGNQLWTWGADIGIKRGAHLWEVDILGATLAGHLGPGLGLVGEHDLVNQRLMFYHRTEVDVFIGNTVADQDQGLTLQWKGIGLEGGYRFFAGQHFHRTGPHIGLSWRFSSEKIPFMFPSMG